MWPFIATVVPGVAVDHKNIRGNMLWRESPSYRSLDLLSIWQGDPGRLTNSTGLMRKGGTCPPGAWIERMR
jgi:hypothetical protein